MSKIDIYDIAQWKPIKADAYAEALGEATLTVGEPDALLTKAEGLPDGRIRIVTYAEVIHIDDSSKVSEHEPYLMVIYSPEGGHTVCFERSVELAHQ